VARRGKRKAAKAADRGRTARPAFALNRRRIAAAVAVALVAQALFLLAYRYTLAEHYARRAQEAVAARRWPAAVRHAERARALNPAQGYASYFAGMALLELGRPKQAADALERALRTIAHRARALRYLALAEQKLNDRTAAVDHLAAALALEPLPPGNPADPHAMLGQWLFMQGAWPEGAGRFRALVADAPEARFYFDGLAVVYEHVGAPALVAASALAMLGSPRLAARAQAHLATLARSPERRAEIRSLLKELLSLCPPDSPEHAAAAQILKAVESL